MQFPTIVLALAASCSLVLAAPLGESAGKEMRDIPEQWSGAAGADIERRDPLFGLGSKKPKVDYQQCCVNCSTQKEQCTGQGHSWGSCMTQYTACAHQCRAAMPK